MLGEAKTAAPAAAAEAPVPAAAPVAEAAPTPAAAPAAETAPAVAPTAHGRKTVMRTYPKIAGQRSQYLFAQMNEIKSGARANGQAVIMKGGIAQVSESEMQAVAGWLSGL